MIRNGLLALTVMSASSVAFAFPPAPHHTIEGVVRDSFGYEIEDEGTVYLKTGDGVQIAAPLLPGLLAEVSYRMEVPMDAGIAPGSYKATALSPLVPFTMEVQIGSQRYLPIEMKGATPEMGAAGGTSYIDLTLGVDEDGDGLPDAWELDLLHKLKRLNGIEDIDPDGDLDHDGLTNYEEYLAHTYAYDLVEGLALAVVSMDEDAYTLEFLAVDGHRYTIHESFDMQTWTVAKFSIQSGDGAVLEVLESEEIEVLRVSVPRGEGENGALFKLMIESVE